jgi:hypothetical protein
MRCPVSETQTCIRGCTFLGRHQPGAHDPSADGDFVAEADCSGCLPRPAEPEQLLDRACKGRATRSLTSLADVAGHVRDMVERGTRRDALEVNYDPVALAPLSIEALTDLDEMAATLATWVMLAVEEHPAGLSGPDWQGARIVPASRRRNDRGEVRYDDARLVGVRAGGDGKVIGIAASWIRTHADWFAGQPWADQWHDEITDQARKVQARWPKLVRARKAPLPCPKCDRLTMWWHPAAFVGLDASVICHADDCDVVLTEEDYWIKILEKRHEMAKSA